jgi:hypothetical protein
LCRPSLGVVFLLAKSQIEYTSANDCVNYGFDDDDKSLRLIGRNGVISGWSCENYFNLGEKSNSYFRKYSKYDQKLADYMVQLPELILIGDYSALSCYYQIGSSR